MLALLVPLVSAASLPAGSMFSLANALDSHEGSASVSSGVTYAPADDGREAWAQVGVGAQVAITDRLAVGGSGAWWIDDAKTGHVDLRYNVVNRDVFRVAGWASVGSVLPVGYLSSWGIGSLAEPRHARDYSYQRTQSGMVAYGIALEAGNDRFTFDTSLPMVWTWTDYNETPGRWTDLFMYSSAGLTWHPSDRHALRLSSDAFLGMPTVAYTWTPDHAFIRTTLAANNALGEPIEFSQVHLSLQGGVRW